MRTYRKKILQFHTVDSFHVILCYVRQNSHFIKVISPLNNTKVFFFLKIPVYINKSVKITLREIQSRVFKMNIVVNF